MFKKRGFLVLFLIFSVSMVWGETTIALQDFDGATPTWSYSNDVAFFDNGTDGFYGITGATGNPTNASNIDYSNITDNFLFVEDLDDEGDNGTSTYANITFDAVDISSYNSVSISFDYDIEGIDGTDYVKYEIYQGETGSETGQGQVTLANDKTIQGTVTENISDSENSVYIVLSIKQNGTGDYLGFDNFKVTGTSSTPDPEPSNYPTDFTATENGYDQVDLSWTDAIGNTLPDGYLIKANETGSFTDPADGTDPAEDTDLSDGSALVKVAQGTEIYSFTGLSGSTQYFFKIWPYTNSGTNINFKTDGTVPTADATTEETPDIPALIISEVADPGDNYKGRFVELFNASGSQIDFSMQTWYFDIQANGGNHSSIQLTGVLPAGDTYVIGNATNLDDIYGAGTTDLDFGNVTGNGNDGYFLFYDGNENNGILYDAYGVIDVDGTDEPWEYEDSRAVRGTNETVTQGNSTWTASEWKITSANVADCTPGELDNDQTLPVTLSTFTVVFVDEQPLLQWKTQSEENNAGWNIYRGQTETAFQTETAQIINFEIIPGAGTSTEPTTYEYSDVFPVQPESSYYYWLESVDYSGTTHLYGPVTLEVPEDDIPGDTPDLPLQYGMQNYPNPFNPSTEISFVLPQASPVELHIYNLKGRKIRTLIAGETLAKDKLHKVVWDGTDSSGQPVSSGIYLYKLLTQEKVYTQKMLLVK